MELKRLFLIIWRWRWLFWGTVVTIFVSTVTFTYSQTPIYETEVRLIVSPSSIFLSDLNDLRSAMTALSTPVVANTYAEISQSPTIVDRAWARLGILPAKRYQVSSSVLQETTIVIINVSGPDPDIVKILAEAITSETFLYIDELTTVYDLTLLDSAYLPEDATKPTYFFNLVFGLVVGVVAALLFAITAEYLWAASDINISNSNS